MSKPADSAEFEIVVHGRERILEVRYPSRPTAESYARYETAVRAAIEAWRGEWDCLVDQSALSLMPPELPPVIAVLNAWARGKGMRRTARVVKDSAVAELQVNRILRESGTAQVGSLYKTRAQAWAALTAPKS
ncbi:MAG: hypothetical protein H6Q89_4666 [Myxococcaceae bacterium]|nr:hypothetical protein [Myxococcaceae bacterium]